MSLALEKHYHESTQEVFRLELLPTYKIPGEWENFQAFLNGEDIGVDENFGKLCASIGQDVQRGKKHVRVRVIPRRVPDYVRFEMKCFYVPRAEAGEEIYLIYEDEYRDLLPHGFQPSDYYLFDSKVAIELFYNDEGEFKSERIASDSGNYCQLRDKLLLVAKSFGQLYPSIVSSSQR